MLIKLKLTIAGSYRRGKSDSGDIDVLLKTPSVKNNSIYNAFIDRLSQEGYHQRFYREDPKNVWVFVN